MRICVGCKHWEYDYLFEIKGDRAVPTHYITSTGRLEPTQPISYDTETLRANACTWEPWEK